MKKYTSLLLLVTLLLFCFYTEAQNGLLFKRDFSNSIFSTVVKHKAAKNKKSSRTKKETVKNLAGYIYIGMDEETGSITDSSENYIFNWGDNGLPTNVTINGIIDEFVEGKMVQYRLTYTNFVKVNAESNFQWFNEDFKFEAKNGLLEVCDNNEWQNFSRIDNTVSAEGLVTESLSSSWLVGAWVNNNKEIYTYNAQCKRTQALVEAWQVTKWINQSR